MTKGRTVLGLCVACALIVSTFAAESASAETTAFTCSKEVTTKTWSDAHCSNEVGTKEYGHVTIPENTTTEITGSAGTAKLTQRLRATINGINTELEATGIGGSGSMHNATVSGEMQATGTGSITYTEVKVIAPAGKGCKAYTDNAGVKGEEGVIHTNELKTATTNAMGVKFEPVAGAFSSFILDGCEGSEALKGLNKTYELTGSVIATPSGGEAVFTHAGSTEQNTLKLNGSIKAGIDGSATFKGRHDNAEPSDPYNALSVKTPEAGGGYKEDK